MPRLLVRMCTGDVGDGGDDCTDTDSDGVCDDVDRCAGTASTQIVDNVGCSDAQVDADGDGVCDRGAQGTGPSQCACACAVLGASFVPHRPLETMQVSALIRAQATPPRPPRARAAVALLRPCAVALATLTKTASATALTSAPTLQPGLLSTPRVALTHKLIVTETGFVTLTRRQGVLHSVRFSCTEPSATSAKCRSNVVLRLVPGETTFTCTPGEPCGCSASNDSEKSDADGDGVCDVDDLCPSTSTGAVVDQVGCADDQVDTDGDGVCDSEALSAGPSQCPCRRYDCALSSPF